MVMKQSIEEINLMKTMFFIRSSFTLGSAHDSAFHSHFSSKLIKPLGYRSPSETRGFALSTLIHLQNWKHSDVNYKIAVTRILTISGSLSTMDGVA